ncbi:hypothetical protein K504DRAFT_288406 [Pleomassaria siparia CBS 279.74]|uniref:Uncharacterized protein n=1 Tax=Pleomassaria siparia CBS 279.74 TaxID=1314801 RepID=A0A6G1K796_9PLEO|nr:hypothetical protein K504DRAFT_288406 [Pleomassaria siparia CBS 279.74]
MPRCCGDSNCLITGSTSIDSISCYCVVVACSTSTMGSSGCANIGTFPDGEPSGFLIPWYSSDAGLVSLSGTAVECDEWMDISVVNELSSIFPPLPTGFLLLLLVRGFSFPLSVGNKIVKLSFVGVRVSFPIKILPHDPWFGYVRATALCFLPNVQLFQQFALRFPLCFQSIAICVPEMHPFSVSFYEKVLLAPRRNSKFLQFLYEGVLF